MAFIEIVLGFLRKNLNCYGMLKFLKIFSAIAVALAENREINWLAQVSYRCYSMDEIDLASCD